MDPKLNTKIRKYLNTTVIESIIKVAFTFTK